MIKNKDFRIVFATTNNEDLASIIAETLVQESLAACCSIISGAISIYEWQKKIEKRQEFILMIKTSNSHLDKLENRIKELHNDEVPEIIAVEISELSEGYMDWMNKTIK
ncbi:MAG: divalent-cation tolerance protein CutA [Desulfobulbaceae bacterium]|nr:divalent-cation tolerance protein CutA [Candidatus Kapabacteria bacterium]MBS3999656.1 divalent-cation tolerance protein CutA [Desulfobulbaceae bacterium]